MREDNGFAPCLSVTFASHTNSRNLGTADHPWKAVAASAAIAAASDSTMTMDAAALITAAISRGAPAYNAGDHNGCYVLYKNCATQLLQSPESLPEGAANRLLDALENASVGSATDRAWAMRHGLDDVLAALSGGPRGGDSRARARGGDTRPRDSSWRVLDFSDRSMAWGSIDDRVMGGSSRSRMIVGSDGATFEGDLVVAGGGFASVRCVLPPSISARLSGASGLLLTCMGDGRSGYKITAKTDGSMDGVMYQLAFTPSSGALQTIKLPLSAFRANFRGRPVQGAPPLRGEDIAQLGIMLSRFTDEGGSVTSVPPGGFRLRVESLAAYN